MSSSPPTLNDIFVEHAAFVLRVVRRMGISPDDVEDVAQDVFLVIHRKLDTYDPSRPIRPWIFGIASRVARSSRRASKRALPDAPPPPQPMGPDAGAELAEARAILDEVLDDLTPEMREVFVAYELEELTMREIAEAVGAPLQTCYSRLRVAREKVHAGVMARFTHPENDPKS